MNLIRQFIAAVVDGVAELSKLRESIEQHTGAVRSANESQERKEPPEPIRAEVSFSSETERQQNCQHKRNYTVQKQIRDATRLAFTAAFIYAGIAAYQGCQMKRATAATERAADAANKSAEVAAAGLRADLVPVWGSIRGLGNEDPIRIEQRANYDGRMSVAVLFKNFGKSDPSQTSASINWKAFPSGHPESLPIGNLACGWSENVKALSHPPQWTFKKISDLQEPTTDAQAYGMEVFTNLPDAKTIGILYAIYPNKPPENIVIYGCVQYSDVIGTHCSNYAARVSTDPLFPIPDPKLPKFGAGFQNRDVALQRSTEDVSCDKYGQQKH